MLVFAMLNCGGLSRSGAAWKRASGLPRVTLGGKEKARRLRAGGLSPRARASRLPRGCARSLRGRLDHCGHLHAMAVRCCPKSDARRCGMAQQKTSKIALRVEPELRDRLEAAAELDRRPVANLIRNVLADWVDSRSREGERVLNR
jgi:hypothetical protein